MENYDIWVEDADGQDLVLIHESTNIEGSLGDVNFTRNGVLIEITLRKLDLVNILFF